MSPDLQANYAAGIGKLGEVVLSNRQTRAIYVCDEILNGQGLLEVWSQLLNTAVQGWVNRRILKAVSSQPYPIGVDLQEGQGPVVEACLPFDYQGQNLYWLVIGRNDGVRLADKQLIQRQREFIRGIINDPKYQPVSGGQLKEAFFRLNPNASCLELTLITPDNINDLNGGLRKVYQEAFSSYPYDPVEVIRQSCGENPYVVALVDGVVAAVTGAEMMRVAGVNMAEVGDSAALPCFRGLGPITKRYLLEVMANHNQTPALLFTDSRIGPVLGANRRAGFNLQPEVILPWHTEISSLRNPGCTREIEGSGGRTFPVENMTMTYLTKADVFNILQTYGPIPA